MLSARRAKQQNKIRTNKQTNYQLKFQVQAPQMLFYRRISQRTSKNIDCDVLNVQDDKSSGTLGSYASSKLPDGADVWTTFRRAWCCRIFGDCDSKALETVTLVSQSQWTQSTHSLHQHSFSTISTLICSSSLGFHVLCLQLSTFTEPLGICSFWSLTLLIVELSFVSCPQFYAAFTLACIHILTTNSGLHFCSFTQVIPLFFT